MGVRFNGFDRLNKKWSRILKEFPEHAETVVAQQGELLIADVKPKTPKDTGTLQNSWKRTPVENMATEVYNNTEYANHVEYGHRTVKGGFVKGAKMLHKAVLHRKSVFLQDTRTIMRDLLDND